jgi:hypothetical protein
MRINLYSNTAQSSGSVGATHASTTNNKMEVLPQGVIIKNQNQRKVITTSCKWNEMK